MKTSLKLEGVADLKAALEALGPEIAERVGAMAVRTSAKELQKEAVATVPRGPGRNKRYGHLFENIRVRRERATQPYTIRYVVTTGRAFWGYFLEVGTVKMAARPWARPLFARLQYKLLDTMLQQLRIGTDRAARRAARGALRKTRSMIGHNGSPALED